MEQNSISARCPICRQWTRIPEETLGAETECQHCRQTVRLVPRSSQARAWRTVAAVVLFLAVLALAAAVYTWRLNNAQWGPPG